jgi:Predicted Rossmann fold nucleotide-binding protein involved in DNA uptake
VALLELLQLPGVGAVKVRDVALSATDGNPERIRSAFAARWPKLIDESSRSNAEAAAAIVMRECVQLNITLLSILDVEYPTLLKGIADPPPLLFVRGQIDGLHGPGIAVVGTREASACGLKIARRVAAVATRHQFVIVSGLALGIDTAAHQSTLDEGGVTVAVLAHGLDTIAPSSNRELALKIEKHGGALVSEHPPTVPPRPPEFVRRNRLQSGLSRLSVIVESGIKGGAIHQARFTREQGRILCAVVPRGNVGGFRAEGGKFLVANEGAIQIEDGEQLSVLLSDIKASRSAPQPRDSDKESTPVAQAELCW